MIELKNLCFSYAKSEVLRGVSLELSKGRLYSVVGVNGSGKSTLLRLISGNLSPSSGEIFVDGRSVTLYKSKELSRKISLLPQIKEGTNITVRELVSLGRFPYLGLYEKMKSEDLDAVEKAMRSCAVSELSYRPVSSLSGGEMQRAYIAMAIVQNTPYVLLDEPTTFLDISHSLEIMELISDMKREGKCVICVTHSIVSALKYADLLVIVDKDDGSVKCMSPEDATESGEIERVFGVRIVRTEVDGNTEYIALKT